MPDFWKKLKKPILALAPMAGYTDASFRAICKKYGADVVYSEMASAVALNYGGKKTLEILKFQKSERPYVVQLFGSDPKYFKNAAEFVTKRVKPDGIDINMGCPARKVFSNGSGAALMMKKEIAREIIKETLKGTKLPVSIKIRSQAGEMKASEFLEFLKDLPLSAVMIHGRSLAQEFSGPVDYGEIKRAKSVYKKEAKPPIGSLASRYRIIILANGGINTPEDAKVMLEKTGADGIGIARGALMRPWIFYEIKEFFEKGKCCEFSLEKIKKAALSHAKLSYRAHGEHGILEMRKYLLWYFRGFENARTARKELVRVKSLEDIKRVLKNIKKENVQFSSF